MATTVPVNKDVQTADNIISFVLYDLAVVTFKTTAMTEIPVLKLPIVSAAFSFAVHFVANKFYTYLSRVVTIGVIAFETNGERSEYAKAEQALREADLSGDKDAIAAATTKFKTTLGSLIRFDGTTPAE